MPSTRCTPQCRTPHTWLDENRIAPNATLPIIIQVIIGGQIDSMFDLLIQVDNPCTLVSILVGGNDIANWSTVTACLENILNIISTIRSKNRNFTVNIIEIPERSVHTKVNENICGLNQLLFNLWNSLITLTVFSSEMVSSMETHKCSCQIAHIFLSWAPPN